jgi:hypothetical protein
MRIAIVWKHWKPRPEGVAVCLGWSAVDRPDNETCNKLLAAVGNYDQANYNLQIQGITVVAEEIANMRSPESMAKMQRSRMEKSMRDKYPLFADELIATELNARPDKYDVEHQRRHCAERAEHWRQIGREYDAIYHDGNKIELA